MVRYGQTRVNTLLPKLRATHLYGHPARDDITQTLTETLLAEVTRELVGKGAEPILKAAGSLAWGGVSGSAHSSKLMHVITNTDRVCFPI